MEAMLRTVNASPGCSPRVTDGHTRESEQANTMYCTAMQQRRGNQISHRQVGEKREEHVRKQNQVRSVPMALIDKQVSRSSALVISSVEDFWRPKKAASF
jgi:hypothetical protein